jgi:hypothetical protein
MNNVRWWAVYRGGEYIEHVLAVSGERALDAVSEREGIPLAELDAEEFDLPEMELPLTPQLLREPGPAVTGKEVV